MSFLDSNLLIGGSGLAAVTALAYAFRRRREVFAQRELAARLNLNVALRSTRSWQNRLRGLVLFRMGHSRRLKAAFRADGGAWLFPYDCQTGVLDRRESHQWRMVVIETAHGLPRGLITEQSWLIAAAMSPSMSSLRLDQDSKVALVQDPVPWRPLIENGLVTWSLDQPPNRNWEFLPGLVVGYEPGPLSRQGLKSLVESGRAFEEILPAQTG